jgi:TolB protein
MGGTPTRVSDTTSLNMSPAWLPDGTLLFVSNRDGPRDIYAVRLSRSGAPRERPVRLTTGLEPYSVSVSADGRTVAYDRFILRRNIFAIPIPRSGTVSLRAARAITTGNQTIENMDLSADGRWLAFDTNLEGRQDIYIIPAGGGEPRRVTRDPGDDFSPDFSADGREIAFYSTRNVNRDIYVINIDGSGERRLTAGAGESSFPAFAPDGLSIAYSYAAGDSSGIWIVRRATLSDPWQAPARLTPVGGTPRWSPDASAVVFATGSSPAGIRIQRLDGASRVVLEAGPAGLTNIGQAEWSDDGRLIYFRAVAADGVEGVYQIPVTGGTPRLLVRLDDPAMSVYKGGAVLAGNGMFYFAVAEIESDVYIMELVRQ